MLGRLTRFLKARRFDVVQTWIFAADTYGRVAAQAGGGPGGGHGEMAVDLWKGRGELAVDRFLARWTDRVVGNSEAVVDFYRKVGIPSEKLAMIPSGIGDEEPPDVDPAAVRAGLGLPADAPIALFAGRLAEQKGVATLVSALDLLQHVRPDVRTLIVGEGPLRNRLEETAHAFELLERRRRARSSATATTSPGSWRRPTSWSCRACTRGCPTSSWRRCGIRQAGRRHRRAGDDRGGRGRESRACSSPSGTPVALAGRSARGDRGPRARPTPRRGRPRPASRSSSASA